MEFIGIDEGYSRLAIEIVKVAIEAYKNEQTSKNKNDLSACLYYLYSFDKGEINTFIERIDEQIEKEKDDHEQV